MDETRVAAWRDWMVHGLPVLGSRVTAGALHLAEYLAAVNHALRILPDTATVDRFEARRLLVELGICGSSVISYHQSLGKSGSDVFPAYGLGRLAVGASATPFRDYFAQIVEKSATGHPQRDAYASLILWNAPSTAVHWEGERVATIPSAFHDGATRSYTDQVGERQLIELFKRCQTLELAANNLLRPIWLGGAAELDRDEVATRFAGARRMLAAVRFLLLSFRGGDERGSLSVSHFMSVFRQYAVHWDIGDVPPSGPQDIEFVIRDIMVGMLSRRYREHVIRIFPGLLSTEQAELSRCMTWPSLPRVLLDEIAMSATELHAQSDADLASLVGRHPAIGECFLFNKMSARVSAAHLALAKSYLYKHVEESPPENMPVPNDRGITGLTESTLDTMNRKRRRHPLDTIGRFSDATVAAMAGAGPQVGSLTSTDVVALFDRSAADSADLRSTHRPRSAARPERVISAAEPEAVAP